ncbi:MAG: GNAT family N-acetyltransferase [Acidimicrobiia bacterium]
MQRAADERAEGVVIRPRTDGDIDACEEMAQVVHQRDGYPRYPPAPDFRRFLNSRDALGAWVAIDGSAVVGHVALHRRSIDAAMELAASATGLRTDELGVVARLLVSPTARRRGVGRGLLDRAVREARTRGLAPILDVSVELGGAIALYEAAGWRRLGGVVFEAADGTSFDEFVYVAEGASRLPRSHA